MNAAKQQTFLDELQTSDETSPKLDSEPVFISMISEIEELLSKQGRQLMDDQSIYNLSGSRLATGISVESHRPVDEIPLFTIPNDGTPIKILLESFFIRNPNDKCVTNYGHSFTDSTGKEHLCCEQQNGILGGSSCLGLIGRPYIEARMIYSDDGTRQIHIIFDLEIENLSKRHDFTDTIQGYKGLRREIYVEIHDSTCGLPQISLVSFLPTVLENSDEIGRICVWISYNTQLPNSSVIAECSHVAFDVNYMCCVSGISTFPIPRGIILSNDEYFPIPRNP
jgi:hypothetical protein